MKNLFLIFVLVLLVGCGSQFVCPNGNTVSDASMCDSVAETPDEEPLERDMEPKPVIPKEEPKEDTPIDSEIQELLDKFAKVKSLSYDYSGPDQKQFKVIVNEKYVKQYYSDLQGDQKIIYAYNSVYFDIASKRALTHCEGETECETLEKTSEKVDYDTWYVKTPFDVAKEIDGDFEIKETRQCDVNKKCVIISDGTIEIGLWDFKGVPLEYRNGEEELYQELAYNSVEDKEFDYLED